MTISIERTFKKIRKSVLAILIDLQVCKVMSFVACNKGKKQLLIFTKTLRKVITYEFGLNNL